MFEPTSLYAPPPTAAQLDAAQREAASNKRLHLAVIGLSVVAVIALVYVLWMPQSAAALTALAGQPELANYVRFALTSMFGFSALLAIFHGFLSLFLMHGWAEREEACRSASPDDCIDILRWADADPVVAAYRAGIVTQGRVFTKGECNAIKARCSDLDQRARDKHVRAAFDAVYGHTP